ncbi:hypothetical protein ACFVAV_20900 [Nocardia sp. NPDC057663]|uniref:hypothetical protein n=1 Tax=Nocardia sp. NPDC057663 TaxID=3346201 RepID=UPI00366E24C5
MTRAESAHIRSAVISVGGRLYDAVDTQIRWGRAGKDLENDMQLSDTADGLRKGGYLQCTRVRG